MDALPTHLNDFDLAAHCLEGNAPEIERLQRDFAASARAFLLRSGASPEEAWEVIDTLWAYVLAPLPDGPARIAHYNGACALQTWLNTVALNRLLSKKRAEEAWNRLTPVRLGDTSGGISSERRFEAADGRAAEPDRAPLLEIMRHAIETAFLRCEAEDFVMLQLRHFHKLRHAELAVMFGGDEPSISRRLKKAEARIAADTLAIVRRTDPWLELTWEDFMDLCRSATPACLGAE